MDNELIIFNNFYKTNDNVYYTSHKDIIKEVKIEEYDINNFDVLIKKTLDKKIEKYFSYLQLNEYEKNSVIIVKLKLLEKLEDIFLKITKLDLRVYKIILNNKDIIYSIYDNDRLKYDNFVDKTKKIMRKIFTWLNTTIKIDKSKSLFKNFINDFWELFYEKVIDKFADIDYGYCITTHKSQASTFSNIYVDMNNIIKCNSNLDESYRCLYTAITRTNKKLNILL